eukprot:m.348769 g.348769  ORF g.348769 m.348769 type:complete len:830 (-) comp20681_c0_seq2:40-2529(-)
MMHEHASTCIVDGASGRILPIHARCLLCRDVIIDPVVLPCDPRHRLCGPCFGDVREKAELCCPFCRKRLSNWIRRNRDNLVDEKLWKEVQEKYGRWVVARHNGIDLSDEEDENDTGASRNRHHMANAGEIHDEYRRFLAAAEAERSEQIQREMAASAPLLASLQRTEDVIAAERALEAMREQLFADQELARRLQDAENSTIDRQADVAADAADTAYAADTAQTASTPQEPHRNNVRSSDRSCSVHHRSGIVAVADARVELPRAQPSGGTDARTPDCSQTPAVSGASQLEQQQLLAHHQRVREIEAADLAFARKLQQSLNGTAGAIEDGIGMSQNRAETHKNTDGSASGVQQTSKSPHGQTTKPKSRKKGVKTPTKVPTQGRCKADKTLQQASIRAHVRVLVADTDDVANSKVLHDADFRRQCMRKCPMCSEPFLVDVLLEHAAVCQGVPRTQGHRLPAPRNTPGTTHRQPTKASSDGTEPADSDIHVPAGSDENHLSTPTRTARVAGCAEVPTQIRLSNQALSHGQLHDGSNSDDDIQLVAALPLASPTSALGSTLRKYFPTRSGCSQDHPTHNAPAAEKMAPNNTESLFAPRMQTKSSPLQTGDTDANTQVADTRAMQSAVPDARAVTRDSTGRRPPPAVPMPLDVGALHRHFQRTSVRAVVSPVAAQLSPHRGGQRTGKAPTSSAHPGSFPRPVLNSSDDPHKGLTKNSPTDKGRGGRAEKRAMLTGQLCEAPSAEISPARTDTSHFEMHLSTSASPDNPGCAVQQGGRRRSQKDGSAAPKTRDSSVTPESNSTRSKRRRRALSPAAAPRIGTLVAFLSGHGNTRHD